MQTRLAARGAVPYCQFLIRFVAIYSFGRRSSAGRRRLVRRRTGRRIDLLKFLLAHVLALGLVRVRVAAAASVMCVSVSETVTLTLAADETVGGVECHSITASRQVLPVKDGVSLAGPSRWWT